MEPSKKSILSQAQTIAVIGCSQKEFRTSRQIASYLQDAGYIIIPIHPDYNEVLGQKVYQTLLEIPADTKLDIVGIFRNKKFTSAMIDQIIEWKEQTAQKPVVWTQMDVSSPEAQQKAENAGLTYIKNKCMMVEHKRLK